VLLYHACNLLRPSIMHVGTCTHGRRQQTHTRRSHLFHFHLTTFAAIACHQYHLYLAYTHKILGLPYSIANFSSASARLNWKRYRLSLRVARTARGLTQTRATFHTSLPLSLCLPLSLTFPSLSEAEAQAPPDGLPACGLLRGATPWGLGPS
jgi:hypothetical protein